MAPFFSVIIPLYNKENYVKNTVKSVLNQSFDDFEIIIINDGSTDKSQIAIECFEDSRIITLNNSQNKGLSETRNIGIQRAQGKVVAFLDADDLWLPDYLITIKNLYTKFPEASIYGTDYLEKYSDKNILEPQKNISKNLKEKSFIISDFFKANLYQSIFCPSCLAIRKQAFKDCQIFDSNITYAEDIDFFLRYGSDYKVAYHYKPLIEKNCNVANQLTRNGISQKTIPDLDRFEEPAKNNPSLKKYLDTMRYIFAHQYILENNFVKEKEILKNINYNNLTTKQIFIIKSPHFVSHILKKIKTALLRYNIKVSTF